MDILERLITRLTDGDDSPDEAVLEDCIEEAKYIILNRRFPYGDIPDDVEPRYKDLQFRIALAIYARMGAEDQTAHSENGISRTYGSALVSEDLLREITPYCGTVN